MQSHRYDHNDAEPPGYDWTTTAYANVKPAESSWLFKMTYGVEPPVGTGGPQRRRKAERVSREDLLLDPALLAPLRAVASAQDAGQPLAELAPRWERAARLLPPVAGERDPLPANVERSQELQKRAKHLRRAIGYIHALTAPRLLAKARQAGATGPAWKALDVAIRDLRSLTTLSEVRAGAAGGLPQAPGDPARERADQAQVWPPLAGDPVVVAQARHLRVSPAAVVALCDLAAEELPDRLVPELLAAGLVVEDRIEPGVYRRTPDAWALLERVVLRSEEGARERRLPTLTAGLL